MAYNTFVYVDETMLLFDAILIKLYEATITYFETIITN
jgi:hypothetical protein